MKFRSALVASVVFHFSIFAIVIYLPQTEMSGETTYYVDLVHFPSGSSGKGLGGPIKKGSGNQTPGKKTGTSYLEQPSGSIRDLTVKKEAKSKLRYPDKEGKKKREPKELISVVRKPREQLKKEYRKSGSNSQIMSSKVLTTGISSLNNQGDFSGGNGYGPGGYSFPYAYYIDMLRSKISSSWYNSLMSPGLRGKFSTVVYFRILRDGTIERLKLEQKSGIVTLDLSALRAVENASPFALLPSDFSSDYLIVHFKFEWEK
ncbi:MAG: TonB C-terminal domain-containing protein [Candidatus Aminicenantes bacterium]|nr:TonB C-terminal domain-containing protein [Candidatus Aminicenantes bacterium]